MDENNKELKVPVEVKDEKEQVDNVEEVEDASEVTDNKEEAIEEAKEIVSITLDGKDYPVKKMTLNDWILLQKNGVDIKSIAGKKDLDFDIMRALIWVVLRTGNKELTLEQAGEILDMDNINDAMRQATIFFTQAKSQK